MDCEHLRIFRGDGVMAFSGWWIVVAGQVLPFMFPKRMAHFRTGSVMSCRNFNCWNKKRCADERKRVFSECETQFRENLDVVEDTFRNGIYNWKKDTGVKRVSRLPAIKHLIVYFWCLAVRTVEGFLFVFLSKSLAHNGWGHLCRLHTTIASVSD